MIAVDTNILVRYFAEDDTVQTELARRFLECEATTERPAFVVLVTLVELLWVLADAYNVGKAILREVRAMRLLGRRISIVLSCRTYDLENDPQIKLWLKASQSFKLEKVLADNKTEYAVVKLMGTVIEAVQKVVEDKIDTFNSTGRAQP